MMQFRSSEYVEARIRLCLPRPVVFTLSWPLMTSYSKVANGTCYDGQTVPNDSFHNAGGFATPQNATERNFKLRTATVTV